MKLISLGFEAHYLAQIATSVKPPRLFSYRHAEPPLFAPAEVMASNSESVLIEIDPIVGLSWQGRFDCGPGNFSGLYATPSETELLVVAGGLGYWVPTVDPESVQLIQSLPITTLLPVSAKQKLICVDFTTLAAYGKKGFLWRTPDVSWDGISHLEVSDDVLHGLGWDAPQDKVVPFVIDLMTGSVVGGSSRELA